MKGIYLNIIRIVAGLVLWLLLWSCDSVPNTPTPIPLPEFINASSVHIEEDWAGYNVLAPVLAHYDLVSSNDAFRGKGFFSMAGYGGIADRPALTDTEE